MLNHMSGKTCIIEAAVKDASGDSLLLPVTALIEILKTGSGNDPIDPPAALTAKMQGLSIDFINDQIGRRDWQLAMDAYVRSGHNFTG